MDMFSALAEPNRRSILEMLAGGVQLPAAAISRKFHVSPPAVSQHLKVLREAGLVRMEKRAQQHLYSINSDAMRQLEGWARRMAEQYEQRFESLEQIAKQQEQSSHLRSGRDKRNGNSSQANGRRQRGKNQAGR